MADQLKPYDESTIRIDFTVRHPTSERFITFGKDVQVGEIKQFFEDASNSVALLFSTDGPRGIYFVRDSSGRPTTYWGRTNSGLDGCKIPLIKVVRMITLSSLKEAKDSVEAATSSDIPMFVCKNMEDAKRAVELCALENIVVEVREPRNMTKFTIIAK
jgi:hypothetical protein